MKINTIQRNLLISASGVLGTLLLVEINSEGLEDSHWIIVTALIAVLLFIAFSAKSNPAASPQTVITAESFANNRQDEGQLIVKKRYNECKVQWEKFLKSSLVDRDSRVSFKDRSDLGPFLEMTAIKLAYANYLLIILHRGPEAIKGDDFRTLRVHAGGILTHRLHEISRELMKVLSGMPPPDRRDSLTMASQQLGEYEALVRKCQLSFRSGSSFPLDPLFAKVDDEVNFAIGDAASRETFFGIKYREETGRLLNKTTGIG